jgi:hypothetical protein
MSKNSEKEVKSKSSSAKAVAGQGKEQKNLDKIIVRGARTHNLKNVTVEMPRHPRIVADAAYFLTTKPISYSGNFHLDEELIKEGGGNLDEYSMISGSKLYTDLYVEEA